MEKIKLAGALIAVLLAVWLILGVGQAAAASLPGEPLYGLKLAAEKARLELTSNPEARSELAVGLMGERLDEITALVEQGQTVDQPTVDRAREHLALALAAASQVTGEAVPRVVERFLTALQERQQRMMGAMAALPQSEQTPVRELLREMDRVRQQLHTGRGEPSGEQERLRQGAPVEATDMPSPAGPHGPSRQPTDRSDGPNPTEDPGYGPGPQPTDEPAGPKPTEGPGQGPGPQPTDRPMRSQPTDDPGHGPGPQPTEPPQGAGDGGSPGDRTGEGGDGRAGRRP